MRSLRIVFMVAFTLWISACAMLPPSAADGRSMPLRLLYQNAHCESAPTRPAGKWISDPRTYRRLYRRLLKSDSGRREAVPPQVDFSREGVLWVTMGRKPTGGYYLEPAGSRFEVTGDTARVQLAWSTPPPGAVLPQVLTRPCLLLAMAKGAYARIRVLDLSGRVRLEISIEDAAWEPEKESFRSAYPN